ncbi:MAG TPA: UDP-N-acetylmuramoyl-L-alanine--D-glutamate ligase [Phycisphaerales bacterium]|nr:UDP-N-acetylmuramoyl-L-alanine--D-glutamate ligase [Phycisphaerales bacterium]HRQ74969.1 UDP-N-acetylmuramoyl-L-alanine--D-glutamate ligase [Phycisphaerales bacterium]
MILEPAGRRVTVMGLGRFGGGVGVVRWLASQNAQILLTDLDSADHLGDSLSAISPLVESGRVTLRFGEHREEDFCNADVVIANPAVPQPWRNRYLNAATQSGVPIYTEIRLLVERLNRRRVIGVTGSAGKSTTAAMIHHILSRAGLRAHLGGNIGGSLLNSLRDIRDDDWVVLELSSAMLYWLGENVGFSGAAGWSPGVAALTNIEPNHLDWHGTQDHYVQSKLNIFRFQQAEDYAIRGDDLTLLSAQSDESNRSMFKTISLCIPGAHNLINAQLAIATVERATAISREVTVPLLADFRGLPHRLQLVAECDGVRYYNDSKSTTPRATLLAVNAFEDPSRVHLIAGGYDKGSDLSPIAHLAPQIAGLYTIGATGPQLAADAASNARFCETLDRAVEAAISIIKPGEVLLLSPGCASWDQFINFEQRGDHFASLVRSRIGQP